MEIYLSMGIGALSGLFMAGAGYLKSYNGTVPEDFNLTKFASTTILGLIVGGIAGATGMTPDVIVALPAYGGLTLFIENLIKSISRFRTQKLP